MDVLVDPRPLVREMRQVTPSAGVLSPSERWDVYRRFHAEERARAALDPGRVTDAQRARAEGWLEPGPGA